jgi:hypothetical protein
MHVLKRIILHRLSDLERCGSLPTTSYSSGWDFRKLSPSPFPSPVEGGGFETLSPGGRGEGEGACDSEILHLKLAPMRLDGLEAAKGFVTNLDRGDWCVVRSVAIRTYRF